MIDFENDNVNLYAHLGLGIGFQSGAGISTGLVENYEKPNDYAGPFIGGNMAFCLGLDHCWDPRAEYGVATKATSITFSTGPSFGFGFDYFSKPLQILEW